MCSGPVFIGKLKQVRFLSWDFIFFFLRMLLFHTESCCEAHSGLELIMQTKMALNWPMSCLSLLSSATGMYCVSALLHDNYRLRPVSVPVQLLAEAFYFRLGLQVQIRCKPVTSVTEAKHKHIIQLLLYATLTIGKRYFKWSFITVFYSSF